MDSRTLTPAQADKLRAIVARQLDYLNRLCGRMHEQRWPLEDVLCREALRARDAVQRLSDAACQCGTRG